MAARQITADEIAAGDRLNLAGAEFTVTARVHGAWYLDCPRARWVEFELIPTGALTRGPQRADRAPAAQRHIGHRGPLRSRLGGRTRHNECRAGVDSEPAGDQRKPGGVRSAPVAIFSEG